MVKYKVLCYLVDLLSGDYFTSVKVILQLGKNIIHIQIELFLMLFILLQWEPENSGIGRRL